MAFEIDLSGQTALIAGGSSGIGLGIAHKLKQAGADVIITGTKAAAADYDDGNDRGGLTYMQLNAVNDEEVIALADKISSLDIFISSVGSVAYSRKEYEMETFRRIMEINLNSVMHLCSALKDKLAKSENGAIMLVGSVASFMAVPGQPAYSASKGALRTLVKSLAHAWARDGIRVNGLAPGYVATKLTKISRDNEKIYEGTLKTIPLRRWGETEEMGEISLFLVSSMSSYMTGQMLIADGGSTL
jgi:3-oxoacyl-[acyl-carrier protein] reductase